MSGGSATRGWPVMLEKLRAGLWSGKPTAKREAWTLDRNWDRTEGERLLKSRDYAAAEKLLSRATIDAEIQGYSTTKRIQVRLLLAEAQRKQFQASHSHPNLTKLEAAEQTVRAAIELAAQASDAPGYLLCLDALADIFWDQRNYEAVETVTREALKMEADLPHPDPLSMARRVHRLGIAAHQSGRSEDAIPTLEKAVKLHEETCGADSVETAHQLTSLGIVYRGQANHVGGQNALRRALKIYEQRLGAQSSESIHVLHHLAGSLEESGDLEAAAEQYERALSFKVRIIGGDMIELAQMQFGMAGLYIRWQNYSRARELLTESIGGFQRKGGVPLAVGHETLAFVEEYSGRYVDALKQLEKAAIAWDALKPERLPELIRNMEHRAELLEMLRKKTEATWMREKIAALTAPLKVEPTVTAA